MAANNGPFGLTKFWAFNAFGRSVHFSTNHAGGEFFNRLSDHFLRATITRKTPASWPNICLPWRKYPLFDRISFARKSSGRKHLSFATKTQYNPIAISPWLMRIAV
jgi:hypothetical protein